MYVAKYELINNIKVEQKIFKIKIFDKKKNIEIYNFCLNDILTFDAKLYENTAFRVSIVDGEMELLLFISSKTKITYIDKIKENFEKKFSSEIANFILPVDRKMFDEISDLKSLVNINRLNNTAYSILNRKIGIDFAMGVFVEKMIDVAIKQKLNFTYQFHLKPYSVVEKKELERYAKKYILRLSDEIYMPNNLEIKLNSIVNSISSKDFFIDEIFSFENETREFYEMILSNEFALKLSQYGFNELPIESDDLADDIAYTGLSSLFIEDVDEIEKIFSSISYKELEKFSLLTSKNIIKKHSENNISRKYDIFISYSTVNTKEAETVCYELEKVGYKCWYAPRDILPSQAYPEQIIRGIKESKYFILLHSKYSTISRYVLREVTKALSLEKIIIPILLDNAYFSENMEFILETCQWIDASKVNVEEKIEALKDVLNKVN